MAQPHNRLFSKCTCGEVDARLPATILLILAVIVAGGFWWYERQDSKVGSEVQEQPIRRILEEHAEQLLGAPTLGLGVLEIRIPEERLAKQVEEITFFINQFGGDLFVYPRDDRGQMLSVTISPWRHELLMRELGVENDAMARPPKVAGEASRPITQQIYLLIDGTPPGTGK